MLDETDLLDPSESPVPPVLKLSAANDGAKLETSRYRRQRSAQINLPFHSFGGQIRRRRGGCLTQALSRLINTYLQPVCEKQLNNTSTLHTEEYRAPPQPKRRIGVNATYADCSRRQRRFITR